MSEHSSIVGGSSASRYINCLGSTALKKIAPPEGGSSDAALLGTMLHFLMEEILGSDEEIDPITLVGDLIDMEEKDPETGETIEIEVTEQHILTKIEPALNWFDNKLNPEEFWLEERVEFKGVLDGAFGTADVLFINGDRAGTADWKFGDGNIVFAEDNDQMRFYLAAALCIPWWREKTKHVKEFDAYIVQPLTNGNGVDVASHATYSRHDLNEFTLDLTNAYHKKQHGNDQLFIGKWCKWCPAEVICPKQRDRGKEMIETLQLAELPKEFVKSGPNKGNEKVVSLPKQVAATVENNLEVEAPAFDMATFYQEAKEIARWAEAVKEYVKKRFDDADPIDGLKKVQTTESRMFTDDKKVEAWVRRQKFTVDQYRTAPVLKSPAQIEKLVGKEKFATLKPELLITQPGNHSIVGLDDPRPSVDDATDPASSSALLGEVLSKQ